MHTIRERWLLLLGFLLLLAAGNVIANQSAPLRETATFLLLVIGSLVFTCFERAGWVEQFYVPEKVHVGGGKDGLRWQKSWGGHAMFFTMMSIYIIYVELTGRTESPLFCILYLPLLLAGLRYGIVISLSVAFALAARYFGMQAVEGHLTNANAAAAISFPLSVLFAVLIRNRLRSGLNSALDQIAELRGLMDVSQMLEMAVDLETTVNLLLINARRIVEADICAVYLLEPDSRSLHLAAPLLDEESTKLAPTLSLLALESGAWSLTSDDILQMHRTVGAPDDATEVPWPEARSNTAMLASLVGSEGVLGLLYVARNPMGRPFTIKDEHALRNFTNHVSMPLQKARYQESLSLLAFRDQMTDLSNFRYFEQRLSEELIRAKRYEQTVTLVIMDIDHFKKFNDDLGHKAGDSLLKQFGFILKDCLRESDLPARYGGEEFIVICPAISMHEARIVAERIRSIFEHTEFDLGESLSGESAKAKITVSVGCATFPNHAIDPGDLVRQADRALYAAKQRGRNIVVTCDELTGGEDFNAERTAA